MQVFKNGLWLRIPDYSSTMLLSSVFARLSYCIKSMTSKQPNSAVLFTSCLQRYSSLAKASSINEQTVFSTRHHVHFILQRTFHKSCADFRLSELSRPINLASTMRKKKKRMQSQDGILLQVTAYQTSKEDFNFDLLEKSLELQNIYRISYLPPDMVDVLHCTPVYPVKEHQKEIFFTRQGSVVFWDVPERERLEVLQFVKELDPENAFDDKFIQDESESMMIKLSEKETCILDSNTINMNRETYNQEQGQLEKYTCSNALMQSLHLSAMERQLEDFIEDTEHLSMDLRAGNRIRIRHREVHQQLGQLFEFRKNLNLCSDLLDTPDFYWDRDDLEKLYLELCKLLQTKYRTTVMNEKLNYCCELMELLNNKFTDARHTKLEWMIIVLILIEVVFEVFHLYRNDYDWFIGKLDSKKADDP
ncbi:required for meiotic nuclear division protein 1 homolog [Crassostrea virginica]|uniref:Required for meiotic nuclear division protein 1 homolog n=1 Tax=Crassostrea virginica TaxID=6565 RepID=A0A8B8EST2_CRAVI|nr:required for meiotic nuclear division protein 1 homolog [Crassostrea virginica]